MNTLALAVNTNIPSAEPKLPQQVADLVKQKGFKFINLSYFPEQEKLKEQIAEYGGIDGLNRTHGMANPYSGSIWVNPESDCPITAAFHEIGHCVMKHNNTEPDLDELEAHSFALALCEIFPINEPKGLDDITTCLIKLYEKIGKEDFFGSVFYVEDLVKELFPSLVK